MTPAVNTENKTTKMVDAGLDPQDVFAFEAESARLDGIRADHGRVGVIADAAGIPWAQAKSFGPSFAPKAD